MVLEEPRRSFNSSVIFCQVFLASLLSRRSKFLAHNCTSNFCASLLQVSYTFLGTLYSDGEYDRLLSLKVLPAPEYLNPEDPGHGSPCCGALYPNSGRKLQTLCHPTPHPMVGKSFISPNFLLTPLFSFCMFVVVSELS